MYAGDAAERTILGTRDEVRNAKGGSGFWDEQDKAMAVKPFQGYVLNLMSATLYNPERGAMDY
jgi:hypothetical protein